MEETPVAFALIGDPQYADRESCGERNYRSGHRLHRETVRRLNGIRDLDFVVSLGDLGDGFSREEIPLMLENLRLSTVPVRHVVGNHDYVQYSESELLNLFGLNSMSYDFSVGKVRFIVLNGLDVSRFSPPGSVRRRLAAEFRAAHPWLDLREWDGMLSTDSKAYLKEKLEASRDAGELAVIFCHVPLWLDASGENARMWDHQELLELLDGFDHVRGWFSGHYHPGGIALRNGVLHKTVRAICNAATPTANGSNRSTSPRSGMVFRFWNNSSASTATRCSSRSGCCRRMNWPFRSASPSIRPPAARSSTPISRPACRGYSPAATSCTSTIWSISSRSKQRRRPARRCATSRATVPPNAAR